MKIEVEIPNKVVQSYLDYFNEVNGTNFQVKTLTPDQESAVKRGFAELMVGEVVMRQDDHSGFETETTFEDLVEE